MASPEKQTVLFLSSALSLELCLVILPELSQADESGVVRGWGVFDTLTPGSTAEL